MNRLFVTGIDTEIGKTYVSAGMLQAWRRTGINAVGMKPVASGAIQTPNGLRNDDALALQAASCGNPRYELVNPCCLPDATAPEIAARRAGTEIIFEPLDRAYQTLLAQYELVLVEGVGGIAVSLSQRLDLIELPRRWQLPCLLVVAIRLGCLNHAWLSLEYLRQQGIEVLGWVANHLHPDYPDRLEYELMLKERLSAPLLGRLEANADAQAFDALAAAVLAKMRARSQSCAG